MRCKLAPHQVFTASKDHTHPLRGCYEFALQTRTTPSFYCLKRSHASTSWMLRVSIEYLAFARNSRSTPPATADINYQTADTLRSNLSSHSEAVCRHIAKQFVVTQRSCLQTHCEAICRHTAQMFVVDPSDRPQESRAATSRHSGYQVPLSILAGSHVC